MTSYPINIAWSEDTFIATSPDFPELLTDGDSEAEATANAVGALIAMVSHYMDNRRDIPPPSPAHGRPTAALPLQCVFKVAIYAEMRRAGLSKTALAERMGCAETQVRRLLDPCHASRTDQIEAAFRALGKEIEIAVKEAA